MKRRCSSKNKYNFLKNLKKITNDKKKVSYLIISIIILTFLVWGIFPRVFATTAASIEKTTDTHFGQGTLSDTVIFGEN